LCIYHCTLKTLVQLLMFKDFSSSVSDETTLFFTVNWRNSFCTYVMKACNGVELWLHSVLISALYGVNGQLHAPCRFTRSIYRTEVRIGLKPRLGVCVDEKSLALPGMTPRFFGRAPCSLLTTPSNHVVYIFTT
jgi:hypothetical protein